MTADSTNQVVWLRRQPVPFGSVLEILQSNHAVIQHMRPEHKTWGVVVDMRQAPPRNDPAFEEAMQGLRVQIESVFARSVVLLATQVGMLQVNRLTREDGTTTFATIVESAALDFARGKP